MATALLLGPSVPAQFARFVLTGGTASLVHAASFLLLAGLGRSRPTSWPRSPRPPWPTRCTGG